MMINFGEKELIEEIQKKTKKTKRKMQTSSNRNRIPPNLQSPPNLLKIVFLVGKVDDNGFHIQRIFAKEPSAERYVNKINSAWGEDPFGPRLEIREWEVE